MSSLDGILSFDRDVAKEVHRRMGGKYTVDQIEDVLRASIQYARMILRYTDVCRVRIPKVGYFYTNVREVKRTLGVIRRMRPDIRRRSPGTYLEEELLEKKIPIIEDYVRRNKDRLPVGSLFTCDIAQKRRWQKQGRSYSEIEDEQERIIKDLLQ